MTEQQIFEQTLELSPDDRAAFLDVACAGDAMLRRRLEALLKSHSEARDFLDVPAVEQLGVSGSGPTNPAADLWFLAPSSEPGSLGRLDHYDVLEVVGRGGMGMVLRARDTKLLRVVALKTLAAPLAASGAARQRFVREARAAAAVRNDHIVAIHAVNDDGPVPYLVMEFIDGCTLESLIRRDGPLEAKQILRIGVQIADGLAAAHKQGLIHRDVKPANILLENGVQRVKLTDFGLARAADDASLTQSGLIAGTPLYMAPEQAAGEMIDARADLFSLGSVLYEMCTGRPAFRAANTVAVIRRVCDDPPRPIREVNPDVPEALCGLIERLHAKKPMDRPASAARVAESLTELLANLQGQGRGPISSRADSSPAAPGGGSRRRLWTAAALVPLVVGLGMSEATGVTDVRDTVIRLFSPEGTLIVEVDDPDVSVTLDGGEFVMSGAGAKEIRLKPGQHKLEAGKDGKLLRRELITVARDGRQIVRVSKESEPLTETQRWERSVAALSAEQQVKAVVRRLKELNPAFDDAVTPTIENGVVTGLKFFTDDIDDISPVRALAGLTALDCGGRHPRKGRLSDLTPIKGLALKTLRCGETRVADLTPLKGMPLTTLFLWNTQISDLAPLRGLPLEDLHCGGTRVEDLSPLRGMRLRKLEASLLPVKDLQPLQGMPLKWLGLYQTRGAVKLEPLRNLPLEFLNLTGLPVSDLSVLEDLKSLTWLTLDEMPVSDLTPVRHAPLRILSIRATRVSDLAPLTGMPLEDLNCRESPVSDLLPLRGLPLKSLRFDYQPRRDAAVLQSLTGLERINDKPAADFLKDVNGN